MRNRLEINRICKSFPGVQALNNVSFTVREGEIMGLVGENGAGKSTLIKIIGGAQLPDEGNLILNGTQVVFSSANSALKEGISVVYQELSLCENLSVAENICIDHLKSNEDVFVFRIMDRSDQVRRTRELLDLFELEIDPETIVGELPLAKREQIEILRAVNYNPKLIILDEPTAPLSTPVIKKLFSLLRKLREQGTSVLYISHEISEVIELCDRVVVLRDGNYIKTLDRDEMQEEHIANLMVGREFKMMFPDRQTRPSEETVLEVEDATVEGLFINISFQLKKNEILGVSGLVGAGRTELALALYGAIRLDRGTIRVNGVKKRFSSPKGAIKAGIAYLTEDRKKLGLFLNFTIAENMLSIDVNHYCRNRIVQPALLRKRAREFMQRYEIKATNEDDVVGTLSGGNQQKILLSKTVSVDPDILIIDEPTRGVDVGAKRAIHDHIRSLAEAGRSIILISSEMTEIIGMSDRILIMDNGKLVDILENSEEVTEELIMNSIVKFKTRESRNGRHSSENK